MVNSLGKKKEKKRADNLSSSESRLSSQHWHQSISSMPFKFLFDDMHASGFAGTGRESN
jgi:hypothetical protein